MIRKRIHAAGVIIGAVVILAATAFGISRLVTIERHSPLIEVLEPEINGTYNMQSHAGLPILVRAKHVGESCSLTVSDYQQKLTMQATFQGGAQTFSGILDGPTSGFGPRILWFTMNCLREDGQELTYKRARAVNYSPSPEATSEVVRLHVNVLKLQSLFKRRIEEHFSASIGNLRGAKQGNLFFSDIRAQETTFMGKRRGFAVLSHVSATIEFAEEFVKSINDRGAYLDGRVSFSMAVTIPIVLESYNGGKWVFDVGEGRINRFALEGYTFWCSPSRPWRHRVGCSFLQGLDALLLSSISGPLLKSRVLSRLQSQLGCDDKGCIRRKVQAELENSVNRVFQDQLESLQSFASIFFSESGPWAAVVRSKAIGLRVTRPVVVNGGHSLRASLAVSKKWLGEDTPKLSLPKSTLKEDVAVLVSFAAVNKSLSAFLDRPFCQDVWNDLVVIMSSKGDVKEGNVSGCELLRSVFEGEREISEWTGLHFDEDFMLPVSLRPMGKNTLEVSVAGMRPFLALSGTIMEVYLRAEFKYAKMGGRASTVVDGGGVRGGWLVELFGSGEDASENIAVVFNAVRLSDSGLRPGELEKAGSLTELLDEALNGEDDGWINRVAGDKAGGFLQEVVRVLRIFVPDTLNWSGVEVRVTTVRNVVKQNALLLVGRLGVN